MQSSVYPLLPYYLLEYKEFKKSVTKTTTLLKYVEMAVLPKIIKATLFLAVLGISSWFSTAPHVQMQTHKSVNVHLY